MEANRVFLCQITSLYGGMEGYLFKQCAGTRGPRQHFVFFNQIPQQPGEEIAVTFGADIHVSLKMNGDVIVGPH